jgi:hypothetical protein
MQRRAGLSGPPAVLPIQGVEHTAPMLTATIVFTLLVAAWGRTATLVDRSGGRRQARSGR